MIDYGETVVIIPRMRVDGMRLDGTWQPVQPPASGAVSLASKPGTGLAVEVAFIIAQRTNRDGFEGSLDYLPARG